MNGQTGTPIAEEQCQVGGEKEMGTGWQRSRRCGTGAAGAKDHRWSHPAANGRAERSRCCGAGAAEAERPPGITVQCCRNRENRKNFKLTFDGPIILSNRVV